MGNLLQRWWYGTVEKDDRILFEYDNIQIAVLGDKKTVRKTHSTVISFKREKSKVDLIRTLSKTCTEGPHHFFCLPVRINETLKTLYFPFYNGDLYDVISNFEFLNADFAWYVLRQIAQALDLLHNLGIEHGDVKPENILVKVGGERSISEYSFTELESAVRDFPVHIVLTDFEFSFSMQDDHSVPLMERGTPRYCAPEIFFPHLGYCKGKSDVYSFGHVIVLLSLVWVTYQIYPPTARLFLPTNGDTVTSPPLWLFMYKEKWAEEALPRIHPCETFYSYTHNIPLSKQDVIRLTRLAKGCLKIHAEERMSMKDLCHGLKESLIEQKESHHE